MNQTALKAFQKMAVAGLVEVYGGLVVMGGMQIRAAVDRQPMTVETQTGGVRRVRGLVVLVPKTEHPVEPVVGTVVLDGGDRYVVQETGGRDEHESAWRLVCVEAVR